MDPQRWSRINELVGRALERPVAERGAFLAEVCRDSEVRREAGSLLAQESAAGLWLDHPPLPLVPREPEIEPGYRIGPYRVVRELGRGGMGVVYEAERADHEYERRVALKVLKRGVDTAEVVRRFRTERQILANLDHPGIAELFEGGTTDDGRPYFVLEYVEGEPIVRYCDLHRLGVRRRLELFRRVCDAVQLAHRNLVVHRDLKPANILVTAGGDPKLLDFGIAKLLDPEGEEDAPQTALDIRPMTPEYASPEQVKGEPITTGTDVYALGLLLYELLTGHGPYRLGPAGGRPSQVELCRAICEAEPMRPSAALAAPPGRHRGDEVKRLRRRLAGDLDWIVLKAMEKDPRRRYASVERLSEDVARHLQGLPVEARKPTLAYRTGKLLRRRGRELVAVGVAVLALAGFLVDREVQQRHTARALVRAERVSDFLVELFEVSDPGEARGSTVTAREVLDRGARRIREELRQEPEVQAALTATIGRVYQRLGLYDAAEPLLREALALRRRELGERHPEVAASLGDLGALLHARGSFEEAEEILRQAVVLGRSELGEDDPRVAELTHYLARVLQARGDGEGARTLYREVLDVRRRVLGEDHPATVESLNDLAVEVYREGDLAEAERLFRRVLSARRLLLGPTHPDVAKSVNNLAYLLHHQGDYEEAEALYRKSLELHRRVLGNDHPDVALSLGILGQFLAERGDFEAAEPLLRDALARHRRLLGDHHPEVCNDLRELAVLLHRRGRYEEAEALNREALSRARALRGEETESVAVLLNNLATVHLAQGYIRDAELAATEALRLYRKLLGEDSPYATTPLHRLAEVHRARGDLETAEGLYREALAIRRAAHPEGHPRVAATAGYLARLLVEAGRPSEAEALAREALAIHRATSQPDWRIAQAEGVLGAALTRLGRYREAEPLLVRSQWVLRETLSDRASETREARERLAELYREWGEPRPAVRHGKPEVAGGSF